ncbi:glycerophosphoryl diester phosphodiesterase [Fictibacillus solisalsi]|uniref:Glycerophosphoryl diester phosphodiesterase n=1 Tax=Fictibacillus solisalsi TaxID=459525 RepID=A0A1G9W5M0_9BACL|nr:glycerophosphodiester phosphodiesterase [Fictibacillus solisalsi]SDM79834.1 glycerophosphoryl diester phosphodiesterase [Fictibacillus solisalsi]
MTKIYGHRGASKVCPENTMAAYIKALQLGAEGLEIDVHLTKDGIPVVIHDETVKRTTSGKGYVKNFSLAEIKQLDAGSWFSPEFQNERIPTLEEFLQWIRTTPLLLNIELKNNKVYYEDLEQKVYSLVNAYGMKERTIYSSFNHYSLVVLRSMDPSIDIAPLYTSNLYEPWNYAKRLGAWSVHPPYKSLHPPILEELRHHNVSVRPFTVNQEKWLYYFFQFEVDAVITDQPDLARAVRNGEAPVKNSFMKKK